MNGAAPLLRLVDSAARSSCSRIPHLKAHIHSRQFRPPTTSSRRPCLSKLAVPSNSGSTRQSSAWSAGNPLFDQLGNDPDESKPLQPWTTPASRAADNASLRRPHSLDARDAHNEQVFAPLVSIKELVQEGNPDRVLFALIDTADGEHFIRTASHADFADAFACLDPEYFIGRYKPVYQHMKPSLHIGPRLRAVRSFEDRCSIFTSCLEYIIRKRRVTEKVIELPVYRHMLRCAESMGDEALAKSIMEAEMPTDHITPDLDCYNSLLGASARANDFEALQRKHHRLTPYHRRRREFRPQENPLNAIRLGRPARNMTTNRREYVLENFRQLNERGLSGNEKTFTTIMVTLGMVGDIEGVKSILRSIWNINVDALQDFDEEEIESPTFYEEDSPLRPSQLLLETVAYVFGSNQDVPTSNLLCDYISRNYNIPISQNVWEQQFELTYQHTYRFKAWHLRKSMVNGNLPAESLERLYNIITDEPHNVQPTVAMKAMLAMNASRWPKWDSAIAYFREANRLLDIQKTELSKLYDTIMETHVQTGERPPFSPQFLADRQAYVTLSLQTEADLQMMSVGLRRLYGGPRMHTWKHSEHYARRLPELLEEFGTFLPNHFKYNTPSGTVAFENGFIHRQYAIGLADDHFARKAGLVRQALDLDDHLSMVERLSKLPSKLDEYFSSNCYMCGQSGHRGQQCPAAAKLLAGHLKPRDDPLDDSVQQATSEDEVVPTPAPPPPSTSLVHVVSPQEMTHQTRLRERWLNAETTGNHMGMTPDPIRRRLGEPIEDWGTTDIWN